ncbi:MAG: TatD family deoxyribonuclease, partial [Verrucomicrobia bacterium]
DTHAHLDFPDFAGDIEEVVRRAAEAGIDRIVTIGCDTESSRRAIALAERFPGVFAAVGWHPGHVASAPADVRAEVAALARHPKVVAIGECGVDHFRLPSSESGGTADDDEHTKARQAAMFGQQLEVAADLGLNVIVHQRVAHAAALEIFRPFAGGVRGVFHCFVGTVAELREIEALGSLTSFTGIATFKNGVAVRDALAAASVDRFMLETDCPYLAPVPHRGRRCEPAYVREIAVQAAAVRGVDLAALSAATQSTVERFFPRIRGIG